MTAPFLPIEYYGNTLLLPNRNLLNAYQLIDWSGWFDAHRGVTLYTSIGNVLDEHYQGGFGYPSLPFNFRAGIKLTIGGEAGSGGDASALRPSTSGRTAILKESTMRILSLLPSATEIVLYIGVWGTIWWESPMSAIIPRKLRPNR